MALTVAPLAGFPANQSALLNDANNVVDAAAFSYTSGTSTLIEDPGFTYVYTQSGTQYVAGILDLPGVVPSRIFPCVNNTAALPTLNSVVLLAAQGSSGIQEFEANTANQIVSGSFVVLLNPAAGSQEDGVYPLGYTVGSGAGANPVAWTLQGGAYTSATTNVVTGYPQPIMKFNVSFSAMLILASTAYG